MPGRKFSGSDKYRYGFNGKETDDETSTQDYGMRIYNPALGRFLSVDPLTAEYPWNSTYAFAENDVIRSIDLDGAEKDIVTIYLDESGTQLGVPDVKDVPKGQRPMGEGTLFKYEKLKRYGTNGNTATYYEPAGQQYIDEIEVKPSFMQIAIDKLEKGDAWLKSNDIDDTWEGDADGTNSGYVSKTEAAVANATFNTVVGTVSMAAEIIAAPVTGGATLLPFAFSADQTLEGLNQFGAIFDGTYDENKIYSPMKAQISETFGPKGVGIYNVVGSTVGAAGLGRSVQGVLKTGKATVSDVGAAVGAAEGTYSDVNEIKEVNQNK